MEPTMTARHTIRVWSHVKMVSLRGDVLPVPDGEPVLLSGVTDNLAHPVCAVKLDDGREMLVAREHLEVVT
jgi:hypothetical protein